ncbi:MAG TPA: flavin reductase family protein [Thermoanaerobaculia bacterium]|nr:flavin reductase family protein [Thermoanaerobaculia bacterium]
MPVDEGTFKVGMSHFASGVTVVTTEHEGEPYGLTVASFASLSLHPPLVLVCVEKSVRSHEAIAAAGRFGVSILEESQADISGRFASKGEDKFSGLPVRRGSLGVPLIEGAVCTIECRLTAQLPGGDHSIFVGEVVDVKAGEGKPLVYYRSSYRQIAGPVSS